jgi:lysophospholipase
LLSPNGNMSNVIPDSSFIVPTSNPIMELNVCKYYA